MYVPYANLFVNKENNMIFDLNNYAIYEASREFVNRLECGYSYLNSDEQCMINDLKEEKATRDALNNKGITAIKIHVSNCCNLMCKYCYANQGNYGLKESIMSEDTADKVVEFVSVIMEKNPIETITFFGGEPLMASNIVEKICSALSDKVPRFYLQTNGTILDKNIIQMIKKYKIGITVSIDGTPDMHDYNRVTRNGKGTYKTVMKNIAEMEREGITISSIQATLTKDFSEQYTKTDIADILYDKFKIPLIKVEYNKSDEIIQDNILSEVEEYIDRIMQGKYILDCETNRFFKRMFSKSYNDYFCEAGTSVISISTDGRIYPCQMFIGQADRCLGTVEDLNLVLKEGKSGISRKSKFQKCSQCIAKSYCSTCGGCVKEETECEQSRIMVEAIIKKLLEFSMDDRLSQMAEKYICFIDKIISS